MPMTPSPSGGQANEAASGIADHVLGEVEQPPIQADGMMQKSAAVVQAGVAEEQQQMEMDFLGMAPSADLAESTDDEEVRTAVDGLNELETKLASRSEVKQVNC